MARTSTVVKIDTGLVDDAKRVLGAKSRTEAVHTALREVVSLRRFKKLMKKYTGRLEFAGRDR